MTEDKSYLYFGQANLHKSPTATAELALFINRVMKDFKYQDADRAGIFINGKPHFTDNYKARLKNLGIIVGENDEIIKRPSGADREKYKASYRKNTEKLSALNKNSKENKNKNKKNKQGGGPPPPPPPPPPQDPRPLPET